MAKRNHDKLNPNDKVPAYPACRQAGKCHPSTGSG
jgi:hypothetical protein